MLRRTNFLDQLIKNKKDGTQILLDTITKKKKFKKIILSKGDIVFFSNRCAHRSKKKFNKKMRRVLYYTYNPIKFGKIIQNISRIKNKVKAFINQYLVVIRTKIIIF